VPRDVLAEIVAARRADIAARGTSGTGSWPRAPEVAAGGRADASLASPGRSLAAVLRRPGLRFVFEVKPRSPSAGNLAAASRDPRGLVRALGPVADAVSVLVEPRFFGGHLDRIQEVRRVLAEVGAADRPILAKDVVVDPVQLAEVRAAGADAVLLMARVLTGDTLPRFAERAAALGLEAVVEVTDREELERALALPPTHAPIIGINHRDLGTLEIDLDRSARLAPTVPSDRVLLGESGLTCRREVDRVGARVDGLLIGSAVSGAADPAWTARDLAHAPVKICGLRDPASAQAAQGAGALWGGLIFAESSRRVDLGAARELVAAAPALRWVGVFREADPGELRRVVDVLGLRAIQLHGADRGALWEARRSLPPGVELWQAVAVPGGKPSVEAPRSLAAVGAAPGGPPEPLPDRLVFDGPTPGSGRPFDWSRLPPEARRGALLAGGLRPENAARARRLGVHGLDVATGVEAGVPGVKCPARLGAFFDALRPSARGGAGNRNAR